MRTANRQDLRSVRGRDYRGCGGGDINGTRRIPADSGAVAVTDLYLLLAPGTRAGIWGIPEEQRTY